MGSRCQKAVSLGMLLASSAGAALADVCRDDQIGLRGDWGEAQFTVEVADDDAERAQGLMHRVSMPNSAGMFFVYPAPRTVGFWMKNTVIPLDILFADKSGTIRFIKHDDEPLSEQLIYGGNNIQYVLEINAGLARALGVEKGSQIRHPAITPELAGWPC